MAFTHGCTIECKSLAENGHLLKQFDVTYFMASVDSLEKNTSFAKSTKADFPLLSDPTKKVAKVYDVLALYGFPKDTQSILVKRVKYLWSIARLMQRLQLKIWRPILKN